MTQREDFMFSTERTGCFCQENVEQRVRGKKEWIEIESFLCYSRSNELPLSPFPSKD